MNRSTQFATVPGEDAPMLLPLGLTLLAAVFAGVAVSVWSTAAPAANEERPTSAVATVSEPTAATPLRPSAATSAAPALNALPAQSASPQASPTPVAAQATPAVKPHCEPLLVDFPSGSATPSQAAAEQLRKRAAFVMAEPDVSIVIDGHSDSLGSDELNLRLSKRRAEALAWVLENAGVPRARITSRGFGAFLPIEGAVEAADINRRGVIHFRGGCPNDLVRKVEP